MIRGQLNYQSQFHKIKVTQSFWVCKRPLLSLLIVENLIEMEMYLNKNV